VWTLVPFYWMVATSLKKDKEIYGVSANSWCSSPASLARTACPKP